VAPFESSAVRAGKESNKTWPSPLFCHWTHGSEMNLKQILPTPWSGFPIFIRCNIHQMTPRDVVPMHDTGGRKDHRQLCHSELLPSLVVCRSRGASDLEEEVDFGLDLGIVSPKCNQASAGIQPCGNPPFAIVAGSQCCIVYRSFPSNDALGEVGLQHVARSHHGGGSTAAWGGYKFCGVWDSRNRTDFVIAPPTAYI
jgi:hypothetical protein